MNKTISRLTLALGVGVAALVGTMPDALADGGNDAKGPDCAELVNGSGTYAFGETPLTRVVTSRLNLAAPACDDVTYRLVVTYTTAQGVASTVETTSYVAEGSTVVFRVDVPELDAPDTVQTAVTTSKRNKAYDETSTAILFDVLAGGGGGSYQG